MLSFAHETLAQRVLFGAGLARAHLRSEVERLEVSRVLVIASRGASARADSVTEGLPVVLRWSDVRQHVPVENAERARTAAREALADVIICVGGGSAVGLAKAVALTGGLPILAVPTTYAGSEATNVWGLTEDSVKTTGVDSRVLPTSIIYDSDLTLSLPVDLSVASGLNALAHCVDSLWAPRANPINLALALEGARALAKGLPVVVGDPRDTSGRDEVLYGAYLAAVSFTSAGSGLHHKICHVLGGAFNLPHAETHAVVLPHVLALKAPSVPHQAARLADALGQPGSAVDALEHLLASLRAPRALCDYGLREEHIPEAVRRIREAVPPSNPVTPTEADLTLLVRAAWSGEPPRSAP